MGKAKDLGDTAIFSKVKLVSRSPSSEVVYLPCARSDAITIVMKLFD